MNNTCRDSSLETTQSIKIRIREENVVVQFHQKILLKLNTELYSIENFTFSKYSKTYILVKA